MRVTSRVNRAELARQEKLYTTCLIGAGEDVKNDLINSQTMPFREGTLQNDNTNLDTTDAKKGVVLLVTEGVQARRLYFHPEYNFSKDHNPNAGAGWFEPYIEGEKKDLFKKSFETLLRNRL